MSLPDTRAESNSIRLDTQHPNERSRVNSIDALRGLVIALMAIDHVRDIFAQTTTLPERMAPLIPEWFFTRWITHFCAPIFVLLAGMSAYLYGRKFGRQALCRFLLIRGFWLCLVELIVVNPSWTLAFPTTVGFVFVQVIWVIGWGMIGLAGLLWLPQRIIGVVAVVAIVGHNALDHVDWGSNPSFGWIWRLAHQSFSWIGVTSDPPFAILVVYPLIPWVAVLWLGYVLGPLMTMTVERRRRILWAVGGAMVGGFIAVRAAADYGNATPWNRDPHSWLQTCMNFLNTQKYPPSLAFLLMTLGPGIIVLGLLERHRNRLVQIWVVYGRVPFFFYVLHVPILTVAALIWHRVRYGVYLNLFNLGPDQWPSDYVPQVWMVYLVWIVLMVPMYALCAGFGRLKATRNWAWLKYV